MHKDMVELIGKPAMYELLAEECCELAQASLKMARILRDENPTPKTEKEVRAAIIEEVTDVELCLMELRLKHDGIALGKKIERFHERWAEAGREGGLFKARCGK